MPNTSAVGVDFGGSHIKIGLLQRGHLLEERLLSNNNSINDLERIALSIQELAQNIAIRGLGLSFAGIIDCQKGNILSTNGKYEWAVGFNLLEWAKKEFPDWEVAVENDARLALLGEAKFGVGKGYQNAVLFMLGTGVGTSAIIEGKMLRGIHYQAGILSGHLGVDIHGLPCNCGGIGCLEAQVGGWQLPHILGQIPDSSSVKPDYKALFQAYEAGDQFAQKIVQSLLPLWGRGAVNLILAYDPEIVILTGGIFHSAKHILPYLKKYVEEHAWTYWGKPELAVAKDVNSSPLLGCEAILDYEAQVGHL